MAVSAREDRRPILLRIDRVAIASWIVFGIVLGVYWVNQVLRGDEFSRQAENNRQRAVPITAPRGFILDRRGEVLAENEPAFTLLLYRRETRSLDDSLRFVAEVLGRSAEDLRRRVERDRSYYDFVPVVLQENLTIEEVGAIQARSLEHPELVVQPTERRIYAQGTTGSHFLGHLGEATQDQVSARNGRVRPGEAVGQKGVEAAYQDLLAGSTGTRSFVIDSWGREVDELDRTQPVAGNTLVLTIDLRLQKLAERYFADKVGSAVALDPRTGEILAMVSSPSFDPNLFTRRVSRADWEALASDDDHPLTNRAIQNVYSPGSVFKAFVARAILAHGISKDERVFCPGAQTFYGRSFRCHGHHGSVDLATALQVSCDVYFYTMGKRLGIDAIAETSDLFGFGRLTGIDVGSEKPGTVPSPEWSLRVRKHPWYPGETISVAIGQGPLLVTSLQLARAFAAIANPDGALPTPHLFHMARNVKTGERFIYRPPARESVPWSPGERESILEGLWRVVNAPGGTAFASRAPGFDMCGKTGSVQVVGQKDTKKVLLLPEKLRDHGWFVGFAPRNDTRIVVAVFVENGLHGASAAAPLAKQLVTAYLAPEPEAPAPSAVAAVPVAAAALGVPSR